MAKLLKAFWYNYNDEETTKIWTNNQCKKSIKIRPQFPALAFESKQFGTKFNIQVTLKKKGMKRRNLPYFHGQEQSYLCINIQQVVHPQVKGPVNCMLKNTNYKKAR